jgi:hypothetical protein
MAEEKKLDLEIGKVDDNELTNEQQLKDIVEDPSINKPTEEDKKFFKDEFEKAAAEFQETQWAICEADKARETLDYLTDFIRNKAYWDSQVFMGVIKFDEVLEDLHKNFKEGETLKVEYQPLEFLAYILQKGISGRGLEDAKAFEKVMDKHGEIAEVVMGTVEIARKAIKEIQFKQDQWLAAEQGFFLEKEDAPEVDNPEGDLANSEPQVGE